tara:strand:+ start:846 stop:1154 length:309 start_codon:yes stop_codon:yes gene_type:complete
LPKIVFDLEDKKTTQFYKRLEDNLALNIQWPAPYLYKFIVPSSEEKVAAIIAVFKNQSAKISSRTSSKGAFTSVSVSLVIKNPEAVIANYRAVATIEGVISL